jgi:hypothetical protein
MFLVANFQEENMFALFADRRMYSAYRAFLSAVILFNALAPTAASASSPEKNPVAGRDGNASFEVELNSYAVEASDDLSATEVAASRQESDEVTVPALVLSIDPDVLVPGGSFTLGWALEG